ncbi:MAG: hypothetical protein DMG50_30340 [Acidobacteria bacterium]|nr:MAG: hypothetical protein DMG50_30340 [Acidobacteriota bacterium]
MNGSIWAVPDNRQPPLYQFWFEGAPVVIATIATHGLNLCFSFYFGSFVSPSTILGNTPNTESGDAGLLPAASQGRGSDLFPANRDLS